MQQRNRSRKDNGKLGLNVLTLPPADFHHVIHNVLLVTVPGNRISVFKHDDRTVPQTQLLTRLFRFLLLLAGVSFVDFRVCPKGGALVERSTADVANVWAFARVDPLMLHQDGFGGECSETSRA